MVGDADDVFWESEQQVATYEAFGREWRHLPTIYDEAFEAEQIDTSSNVGRRVPAPGMWLWAAATMWFGGDAFRLIDRDRLLDLPVGSVVEVDALLRVDLFEPADELSEVRAVQREFRAWIRYGEIEARSVELAREFNDPHIEIERGHFTHGGVRRVTRWLSEGMPVARSSATSKYVVELGRDGTLMWHETTEG